MPTRVVYDGNHILMYGELSTQKLEVRLMMISGRRC